MSNIYKNRQISKKSKAYIMYAIRTANVSEQLKTACIKAVEDNTNSGGKRNG